MKYSKLVADNSMKELFAKETWKSRKFNLSYKSKFRLYNDKN